MPRSRCLVCGKSYTRKSLNHHYCSGKCRRRNEWDRERLERKKNRKEVKRICKNCQQEFIASLWHPLVKFCSQKCRSRYYKIHNRKKILAYKRIVRKSERYLAWKRNYDRNYKDKIRYGGLRRPAMERANFSCEECGAEYPNVNLVVHHKDGNKQNNIMANLQVLCRICHARLHQYGSTGTQ